MNNHQKSQTITQKTAQLFIYGYQRAFSFREPTCRYLPSCSEYANDAIEYHGVAKGSWMSLKRLFRCHPWGDSGYDPVPVPPRRNNV